MKFFDRKEEIASLRKIRDNAEKNARFTVLTGRRRIGKTSLVLKAYEDRPILYFFVGRKAESLLCDEFRHEAEDKLGVRLVGSPTGFTELFDYLMQLSKQQSFTLFIDEFQNFARINSAIFSDMQKIWDLNHCESRINLVVCGSVYSMMTKIFRGQKEPLYNRQNRFMTIQAFKPSVLKEILDVYYADHSEEDLLALYTFTGGVAKYVELLADDNALSLDAMIDSMISPESTFINEGRSILIEEFGKDYDTYFSILSAIASGKTRRSEIESIIGRPIGGYLTRLEEDYEIIAKQLPLGAKPLSKNAVYVIRENFFTFWFRFIFKYAHILEIGGYGQLRTLIKRDYSTYSGVTLERYFMDKAIESGQYTLIGRWWDRKGENEIDMIAANELDKKLEVYEIKRNRKNMDFPALEKKAKRMLAAMPLFNGYNIEIKGLDMNDM
ncbi:MAG: ATP-binding protein [Akkermansiaceae bacterium]|nr:ATP-binding protein [Akkermansiaceae bacterium]